MKKVRRRCLQKIARELLKNPEGPHYGTDLWEQSRVRTGRLYPELTRMFRDGWLTDGWEELDSDSIRPPRRYFVVTPLGLTHLRDLVEEET